MGALTMQYGTVIAGAEVGRKHKTINKLAYFKVTLLPWLIFCTVFWLMAGYPRFISQGFSLAVTFLLWVYFGVRWFILTEKPFAKQASVGLWFSRLGFVYVSLAYVLGDITFWHHFYPFFHLHHMATYVGVNPSQVLFTDVSSSAEHGQKMVVETERAQGKRYQDAGVVYFQASNQKATGIKIDKDKAISFRHMDNYCAAPIVDPTCTKNCGYDFWAVGVNCCGSDDSVTFTCADHLEKNLTNMDLWESGALRWQDNASRPFFRLAVMEAEGIYSVRRLTLMQEEGIYSIQSKHPIFFEFVPPGNDPAGILKEKGRQGYIYTAAAMVSSLPITLGWMMLMAKTGRVG